MLKLKRVELQGFKSFCDRAEMRFQGTGIAAIVGPNGCGKSNVSDAISWVLGEQSAKSLRGGRMEDVIFAGTRDRKPLGMAFVTLTMADPEAEGKDGKPGEVTITRRLFRSGDSEYLVNGKTARLRDIQDLFMGTGLGPESYAIIEQGRIGQILSTRPQDRRAVIEEAAGITRFKTKRRLAETRLDGAKQNLTRVFDILEEVGRQVTTLKRQAAKAKRYAELRAEWTGQLRIALAGRHRLLTAEAERNGRLLDEAATAYGTLATHVGESEAQLTALRERCYLTETELRESRKALAEQRVELERARGRRDGQARQIHTIEQRLQTDATETHVLEQRLAALQAESQGHGQSVAELEQQAQAAQAQLAAKERERTELLAGVRERERAIEQGRQQVIRLLGEIATLRNQLAQVDEFLSSVDRDLGRTDREEQAAATDLERLNGHRKQIADQRAARQLELQELGEQRRETIEELNVRRSQVSETRRRLEALKGEASRLKARRESLEDVLAHHSYATGAVRKLFTAVESGQVRDLPLAGVLADFVEADAAYEKAIEEYLHEELEYIVVEDWVVAERGVEVMRTLLDGRATFFVRGGPAVEETGAGLHTEAGVLARLTDVLRPTAGLAPEALGTLPRIAHCYLVEDRQAGQRLSSRFPHLYFLAADGLCFHGHALSGGKKSGGGPLALKREARELGEALDARHQEVERTARLLGQWEEEVSVLEEDAERLRSLQQAREKDALALDVELRKLGEETTRTNSRLSIARLELQRLRQQNDRSREQRDRQLEAVEAREESRQGQERALVSARGQLETLQGQSTQVAEEHAELRVAVAELEERRRAGRSAQQRLEAQARETATRLEQLRSEMTSLQGERVRLEADNRELDVRAEELASSIARLDASVAALVEDEAAQRSQLQVLEAALKERRIELQTAQERRSRYDVERVRLESTLTYLDETCRKELDMPVAELAAGEDVPSDEGVIAEAEARARETRSKIDALGPVNAQALEEFEEAQQRHEFLSAQRQDLLDSIRDTEQAIREIDAESRRRFAEAFAAINEHFRELFRTLFNGGTGEMRLTDEENTLESGIDIVAQPPNKRLQNVLLLSGGEKALTAMALLMATFRYQPSPFCILDEVDAPLDEPNTERLTRLLKEMSTQTQFVVITHSKRTMEAAEAMYGVTMQEPGVSKLVSVRFHETAAEQAAVA